MWFQGVEVEQETSAPAPKKNPGSAPLKETSPRGGGGVLNKVLYGKAAPNVPTPLPFYKSLLTEKETLSYIVPSIDK